jgi:hypothetical protein
VLSDDKLSPRSMKSGGGGIAVQNISVHILNEYGVR